MFHPWLILFVGKCPVCKDEATILRTERQGKSSDLRQDGVYRKEFVLTPGVEVGIGATVMIAESLRSIALREFCQRLLGWGVDRLGVVDHALRAIRLFTSKIADSVVEGRALATEQDFAAEKIVTDETPAEETLEYSQYVDPKYAEEIMAETFVEEEGPASQRKGPGFETAEAIPEPAVTKSGH